MGRLLGLTAVALALVVPSSAQALPTLTYSDGSPATVEQQIIDRSKVPSVDGVWTVKLDGCGLIGRDCVDVTGRIVYLTPDFTPYELRHELGHAFDQAYLADADREAFSSWIAQAGQPWYSWGDSPAEAWADAYAQAAKYGAHPTRWARGQGRYGYIENRWRARHVTDLIRSAAAR